MASDETKSPGIDSNQDDAAGKPKRPSRVIDLEATEVETSEEPDKPDLDKNPDPKEFKRGGKSARSKKASRPTPPQRTKPSELKGFVTHLAAGLAGGLIGVIGAGMALDRLPRDDVKGAQQVTSQDLQNIGQRLDALDASLAEQAKSGAAAGAAEDAVADARRALNRMEARLEFVETRPESAVPDLKPLKDRLDQLEETLETLQSAGAQEGASGLAQSAALTGKIADVSRKLARHIALTGQEISELKSAMDARLSAQEGEGNEGQISALVSRLERLEKKITELASRPAALPVQGSGRAKSAALALALEILRRTVDRGEPFGGQLDAVEKAAPDGVDLSVLAGHAGAGVSTDASLLAELAPALRSARAAAAGPAGDTFLDRLVSNARSVVRVRRLGSAEGTHADAVLSRMDTHMRAADLAGVLRQGEDLSGAALRSLEPWLEKARARNKVKSALAEIERDLLAGLQSGPGAGKSR